MFNQLKNKTGTAQRAAALSAVVLLGLGAIAIGVKTYAFKPANESFGHTCITRSAIAKDPRDCGGVSADPSKSFKVRLSAGAGGREIYFSPSAQKDVVLGTQSNDWTTDDIQVNFEYPVTPDVAENPYRGDIYSIAAHCDDEAIPECRQNILNRRELAMKELTAAYTAHRDLNDDLAFKRARNARMWIGKAMHTIQDFYAHSNYAETRAVYGSDVDGYYAALTGGTALTSRKDAITGSQLQGQVSHFPK